MYCWVKYLILLGEFTAIRTTCILNETLASSDKGFAALNESNEISIILNYV
jgi:hypothetical protein